MNLTQRERGLCLNVMGHVLRTAIVSIRTNWSKPSEERVNQLQVDCGETIAAMVDSKASRDVNQFILEGLASKEVLH